MSCCDRRGSSEEPPTPDPSPRAFGAGEGNPAAAAYICLFGKSVAVEVTAFADRSEPLFYKART